jgi:hypothetical protein
MENERHRHGLSQKALLLAILKEIEELANRIGKLEEVANAARQYLGMLEITDLDDNSPG